MSGAYLIIDGQWGSTGKGKLAAYLAEHLKPDAIACDFMPNAGHTWVDDNGNSYMTQQLPSGAFFCDGPILIGPGSAINPETFFGEIERYKDLINIDQIKIHPHAAIIEDSSFELEAQERLVRVSSTLKGCGGAQALKALRSPRLRVAKDVPELKPFIADTVQIAVELLESGATVQVEGAQGFGLSLNYGFYPYVTSRDILPGDTMSRAGVPLHWLRDIYGSIRTFPIRVGNVEVNGERIGWSGPHYDDQEELDWETVTKLAGAPAQLEERTTVTNKVRRVFTFSIKQLEHFVKVCNPTHLFINFVNYLDWNVYGAKSADQLTEPVREFLRNINDQQFMHDYGVNVSFLGTGPKQSEMIQL